MARLRDEMPDAIGALNELALHRRPTIIGRQILLSPGTRLDRRAPPGDECMKRKRKPRKIDRAYEGASPYMASGGADGAGVFTLRGARFFAEALRAPFLAPAFFTPRFLVAALRTPLRAVFFAADFRVALRAPFFAADFFVAAFLVVLRAPFFAAAFLAGLRLIVALAIISPLDPNCRNFARPTIRSNSVTRLISRSRGKRAEVINGRHVEAC